jgi:hypothetical protein
MFEVTGIREAEVGDYQYSTEGKTRSGFKTYVSPTCWAADDAFTRVQGVGEDDLDAVVFGDEFESTSAFGDIPWEVKRACASLERGDWRKPIRGSWRAVVSAVKAVNLLKFWIDYSPRWPDNSISANLYSKTSEEHHAHMKKMLNSIEQAGDHLALKRLHRMLRFEKCVEMFGASGNGPVPMIAASMTETTEKWLLDRLRGNKEAIDTIKALYARKKVHWKREQMILSARFVSQLVLQQRLYVVGYTRGEEMDVEQLNVEQPSIGPLSGMRRSVLALADERLGRSTSGGDRINPEVGQGGLGLVFEVKGLEKGLEEIRKAKSARDYDWIRGSFIRTVTLWTVVITSVVLAILSTVFKWTSVTDGWFKRALDSSTIAVVANAIYVTIITLVSTEPHAFRNALLMRQVMDTSADLSNGLRLRESEIHQLVGAHQGISSIFTGRLTCYGEMAGSGRLEMLNAAESDTLAWKYLVILRDWSHAESLLDCNTGQLMHVEEHGRLLHVNGSYHQEIKGRAFVAVDLRPNRAIGARHSTVSTPVCRSDRKGA